MGFIEEIASYVQKYAPEYGIKVCSSIIAQAVLESASGTSYKATYGHNYFGLKYRDNRCPVSIGKFVDKSKEDAGGGKLYDISDYWFKFANMEDGVIGYFQFINISTYANLKGVTDPREYLENIKADGYATSTKYVDNLMAVIEKYGLTKYDSVKGEDKMVINIHAGHNPDGKVACGAVGLIKESTEARKVKDEVIRLLRAKHHIVYDCTCNDGTSQNDVLKKIVAKCNLHTVDLDVSIHFNSSVKDFAGNGVTSGTEVFLYSVNGKAKPYAQSVVRNIAKLGYRIRDDVIKDDIKTDSTLYVLKNTKAPAMLVECCFVDDKDDVKLYDYKTMAQAIAEGITGA